MKARFDWNSYYRRSRLEDNLTYDPVVMESLAAPTEEEVRWLLEDCVTRRRWFVAINFERTAMIHEWIVEDERNWFEAACLHEPAFPELFFRPLMDAGIDRCEPSGCRPYVVPCAIVWGAPRVLGYLHDVIEAEPDRRKVGALLALYFVRAGSSGQMGCRHFKIVKRPVATASVVTMRYRYTPEASGLPRSSRPSRTTSWNPSITKDASMSVRTVRP